MNQTEFNQMLRIAFESGVLDENSFKSGFTGEEIEAYLTKMKNAPAGSTSMDAEVIDIRTGHDGTVYPTAGEAVRQIGRSSAKLDADGKLPPDVIPDAEYITDTMLAASWMGSTYSFEEAYPHAQYDIEVSVAPTATVEQFEAFGEAMICGSATENVATALNGAPTVDIPIIVKVVAK